MKFNSKREQAMFVVETYIEQSKINGIGVYSKSDVQAGSLVWEFLSGFDLEFTDEVFDKFPPAVQKYILHYGNRVTPKERNTVMKKGRSKIPAKLYLLCSDNARFMNHSDDPNISAGTDQNYALRDIAANEEITCDYREFDVDFKRF
jgi:SET domain-containing protein